MRFDDTHFDIIAALRKLPALTDLDPAGKAYEEHVGHRIVRQGDPARAAALPKALAVAYANWRAWAHGMQYRDDSSAKLIAMPKTDIRRVS